MAVLEEAGEHLVENGQFSAVGDHILVDDVVARLWVDVPAHQVWMVDDLFQLHHWVLHFDTKAHRLLHLLPGEAFDLPSGKGRCDEKHLRPNTKNGRTPTPKLVGVVGVLHKVRTTWTAIRLFIDCRD